METIQNNLRHYRKLKGLTQWDVARHLGFKSIDRISKWEAGKQWPHARNLLQIAELLQIHAEELYKKIA
jgi:transcriptional regulator with XRE-family HTH domain